MTLGEIQNDIIFKAGKGAQVDGDDLLATINEGIEKIRNRIIELDDDDEHFVEYYTPDIVLNQQKYTLGQNNWPSTLQKLIRIEVKYSDQDKYQKCTKTNLRSLRRIEETTKDYYPTAKPKYYREGTLVGLVPTPDQTLTDGVKLWGIPNFTPLTETSDEPPFDQSGHHLVVEYGLAWVALGEDEDLSAWQVFLKDWEGRVDDWLDTVIDTGDELRFAQDVE
jgi:hypothetical protein